MSEEESKEQPMTNEEAVEYLSSFMGKSILITTTDERKFFGTMKCTDRVSHVSALMMTIYAVPVLSNAPLRIEISY